MKKSTATTITAAALAVAVLITGGSYAYRIADTQVVTNEFDYKVFDLDLKETVDPEFEIDPGKDAKKDPYFTLTSDTDSYVFMKVDDQTYVDLGNNKVISLVDYALATGWTQLTDKNGNAVDGVFYYANSDESIKVWGAGTYSIGVLKDDKVTYPEYDLSNAEKVIVSQADIYLAFQGWAIEAAPFVNSDNAAYDAWMALDGKAPDAKVTIDSNAKTLNVLMYPAMENQELTVSRIYTFEAVDTEETVSSSEYASWIADYYVSADKDVEAGSITLVGHYDAFTTMTDIEWVGLTADIDANESYPLVQSLLYSMTYKEIVSEVGTFKCGISYTDKAIGTTVTVELRVTNPSDSDDYITVGTWDYTCR